jgi:hypothetical protein
MPHRSYPLVAGLALAASLLLLAFPLQASACPGHGKPVAAGTLITNPNDPRFAEQMVELYRQWGQSAQAVAPR